MKYIKIISHFLIILLVFSSCSKQDYDPESMLVKKITSSTQNNTSTISYLFTYNDSFFPKTIKRGTTEPHTYTFDYDEENNLTKRSSNTSPSKIKNYQYDSEGRLTSFYTENVLLFTDVNITYHNDNTASVTGVISGQTGLPNYDLTFNNQGQVIKLSYSETRYSLFEYDSNSNLILARSFYDLGLIGKVEIAYDDKPNPYYREQESDYLTKFLPLYYRSYPNKFKHNQATYYPFSPNNITAIIKTEYETTSEQTFEYDYDNNLISNIVENYVIGSYSYSKTHNLEYYN